MGAESSVEIEKEPLGADLWPRILLRARRAADFLSQVFWLLWFRSGVRRVAKYFGCAACIVRLSDNGEGCKIDVLAASLGADLMKRVRIMCFFTHSIRWYAKKCLYGWKS